MRRGERRRVGGEGGEIFGGERVGEGRVSGERGRHT
jgi:hypothetical protein